MTEEQQRLAFKRLDNLRTQWLWLVCRSRIHQSRPGSHPGEMEKDVDRMSRRYDGLRKETADELEQNLWINKDGQPATRGQPTDLRIKTEWLRRWFCIRLLRSDKVATECSWRSAEERKSPFRVLDLLFYISIFVLERLHHLREQVRKSSERSEENALDLPFADAIERPDREALRAELVTVTEFAHLEIGVARELKLYQLLWDFLSPQLFLYGAEQSYRDHLFHVLDACLFGYFLLCCYVKRRFLRAPQEFAQWLSSSSSIKREKLLQNWFFASLLHDLGHSLDTLTTGQAHLAEYSKCLSEVVGNLRKNFEQEAKKLSEHISKENPPVKIEASAKWLDHGVCSWVILRDIIQSTGRQDLLDTYQPGLLACAKHNLPEEKIELLTEPVSFLLKLCDIIQDWGRPRIPPEEMSEEFALALRQEGPALFTMRESTRWLEIHGTHSSNGLLISPRSLKITLYRESPEQGISQPAIAWILICRDLQNLDTRGVLDLELTMDSPVSHALRELPWEAKEMDALQDFLRISPEGSLLTRWLEVVERSDKNNPVQYKYLPQKQQTKETCATLTREESTRGISLQDNGARERFTVRLSKLSRCSPPLIRRIPENLYVKFVEWKWEKLRELRASAQAGIWPERQF